MTIFVICSPKLLNWTRVVFDPILQLDTLCLELEVFHYSNSYGHQLSTFVKTYGHDMHIWLVKVAIYHQGE